MDTGSHRSRKWQNLGFQRPSNLLGMACMEKLPKKYQLVVIWISGRAVFSNYVGKRPWYKQSPSK